MTAGPVRAWKISCRRVHEAGKGAGIAVHIDGRQFFKLVLGTRLAKVEKKDPLAFLRAQ